MNRPMAVVSIVVLACLAGAKKFVYRQANPIDADDVPDRVNKHLIKGERSSVLIVIYGFYLSFDILAAFSSTALRQAVNMSASDYSIYIITKPTY